MSIKRIYKYVFIITLASLLINAGILIYGLIINTNNYKKMYAIAYSAKKGNGSRVAFIKLEEIEKKYLLMQGVKRNLEKKEKINETKLNYLLKNYQSKLLLFQQKKNKMADKKTQEIEIELENLKNTYKELKAMQDQEFKEEQFKSISQVKRKIQEQLLAYNNKKHFDYILTDDANFIYYKDPINDITEELITELNKNYLQPSKTITKP